MALMKMPTYVGGAGNSGSLYADTTNLLHSITTINTTWTATQDCIMIGNISYQAGASYGMLYLDDVLVISNISNTNFGDGTSGIGFFIPKGTVVKSGGGTFSLNFYAVA